MANLPELATLIGAGGVLGGIGTAFINKFFSRNTDAASAEKLRMEAREAGERAASEEVRRLRDIIQEVRESEKQKSNDLAEMRTEMQGMKRRVDLLEERERHQLTRAAVHEAWDVLAFQHITREDGQENFPMPPPLAAVPDHDGNPTT